MEIVGSMVRIRQLQVLREVLRAGSERLAARALGISQPAVSQNVRQLEEAIGFALFRRETNRLIRALAEFDSWASQKAMNLNLWHKLEVCDGSGD
ncbi:LysR family transcriptional regulator, partial [Rhizobium sp. B209b/85]|uniref:helix-turn-helix domain-containing protein n=1 Tax=Rhizobium sp. B209b/85 TaxID=2819992 RepID=UPI001ADB92B4